MKIAFILLYLVVAIAMIAFIMLQRGSGAAAGSGFGAGASGTVFGARGSSNFLSKSTKWLAILFFALSMGMAVYEARVGLKQQTAADLGVMSRLPAAGESTPMAIDATVSEVPVAEVPAALPESSEGDTPAPDASVGESDEASKDEENQP